MATLTKRIMPDGSVVEVASAEPSRLTLAEQNAAEGRTPIDLSTMRAVAVTGAIQQVSTSAGRIPIAQSKPIYGQSIMPGTQSTPNGTLPDGTPLPDSYNPYPAPLPAAGGSMLDSIPVWAIVGAAALAAFVLLKK